MFKELKKWPMFEGGTRELVEVGLFNEKFNWKLISMLELNFGVEVVKEVCIVL